MMESYGALPEPCSTMKIGVVPNILYQQKMDKNIFKIIVNFPIEYLEIQDERVEHLFL